MTALTVKSEKTEKMNSIDFLKNYINPARLNAGEPELRNNSFNLKVVDECEGLPTYTKIVRGNMVVYYYLTKDQLMLVGMRESKAVRRSVLEKLKLLENNQPQIPTNFSEALLLAAEQAKQLELAKPAIEFIEKYVESNGLMTFRETAQILNTNEREFRNFLVNNKIMYKLNGTWAAYKVHASKGYFDVKTGTNDNGRAFKATFFTAKGINWITQQWENKEMMVIEKPKKRLSLKIYMNCKAELNIIIRDLDLVDKPMISKNVTEKFAIALVKSGGFHELDVGFSVAAARLHFTFDYYAHHYPKLLNALTA